MTSDLFLERDAVISDCERYRYLLRRAWDHDGQRALFIMLNPSTADAEVDDTTIRSCIRLCKSWGYGSFEAVNLYGYRATDPKDLAKAESPVGPDNDRVVEAAVNRCDTAICAWGANGMVSPRNEQMLRLIWRRRHEAWCLGTTKAGHPKHPLYIKSGTPLVAYRGVQ